MVILYHSIQQNRGTIILDEWWQSYSLNSCKACATHLYWEHVFQDQQSQIKLLTKFDINYTETRTQHYKILKYLCYKQIREIKDFVFRMKFGMCIFNLDTKYYF